MFPLPYLKPFITSDDQTAYNLQLDVATTIPVGAHCGAFGVKRRFDIHTGIDLYANDGHPVVAIQDGIVVAMFPFTGSEAYSPWWLDTAAIAIEDESGIWLYGEVKLHNWFKVGDRVLQGNPIGNVARVIATNKGRPTSMLHLERYASGCREFAPIWNHNCPQPPSLLDPTDLLISLSGICK